MARWEVGYIPDLFRYQSNAHGELLEGVKIRMRITAGGKLIVTTFARQQRPGPSYSPTLIRLAIVALAITIVIVSAPAWAERRLNLEHSIDDSQLILDERIVRAANSITNEFQKTRINDCLGRKFIAITGALIRQGQGSTIGIFVCAMTNFAWVDSYVVPRQSRNQGALRCDRPTFNMRLKEISVVADEFRCALVASISKELGGAYQSRNMGGQCGWRIAAGFFPAILRGDWTFSDEKPASPANHTVRIEVSQRTEFPESPRQNYRQCHFVQLYAEPIGPAVDPEILIKTTISPLRNSQINQRA